MWSSSLVWRGRPVITLFSLVWARWTYFVFVSGTPGSMRNYFDSEGQCLFIDEKNSWLCAKIVGLQWFASRFLSWNLNQANYFILYPQLHCPFVLCYFIFFNASSYYGLFSSSQFIFYLLNLSTKANCFLWLLCLVISTVLIFFLYEESGVLISPLFFVSFFTLWIT